MKFIFSLMLVVQVAAGAAAQQEAGSIAGVVLDGATQQPVPSVLVVASRAGAPPFTRNTRSGGDGAFTIEGLTPGNYLVCVQPSGDQYVNSCQWDGGGVGVVVAAGQSATGTRIALAPTSLLTIEVTDDQNVLAELRRNGQGPELSVGVWGPRGLYYPALAVGAAKTPAEPETGPRTYIYRLAVPQDIALQLDVSSRDVKLGDANGIALSTSGRREAFKSAPTGATQRNFKFTVLGRLH